MGLRRSFSSVSLILTPSLTVFCVLVGKTPEEVVKRYLQKVRNPPEEVSSLELSRAKNAV